MKHKRLLIIAGLMIAIGVVAVLQFLSRPKQEVLQPESELIQEAQSLKETAGTPTIPPNQSVALQKAIQEAKQTAQEYQSWDDSVWTKYPWNNKLPIVSERYYAYFDLEREAFIGKLYPRAGDDAEQLKDLVRKELKEGKGIPIENFRFEWQIIPK